MGLAMPVTCKVVQNEFNDDLVASYASMQGYRESMEDAHTIALQLESHPGASFFGVYDGHGGPEASAFIKKELPQRINALPELTEESIRRCVLELDVEFLRIDNEHRQHGSTVVFAIVRKLPASSDSEDRQPRFDVLVANVGDSRCLVGDIPAANTIVDTDSVVFRALSEDHKPGNPVEKARISRAGGFVEMGRVDACLALSRAVGDSVYKANSHLSMLEQKVIATPDFDRAVCGPDHFLLVACDGIFENSTNESVAVFVANALASGGTADPATVLDALLEESLGAGSRDNMTAILVLFRGVDSRDGPIDVEKRFVTPDLPDTAQGLAGMDRFVDAYVRFAEKEGFSEQACAFLGRNGYSTTVEAAPTKASSSSAGSSAVDRATLVIISIAVLLVSYIIASSSQLKSLFDLQR